MCPFNLLGNGTYQCFPFDCTQLMLLFLVMQCKDPGGNNIETGGRSFFSELGCIMQKNSVFAKIFYPGL